MKLWEYGAKFIGTPYLWGGNSPWLGYDCSGFIQEILASQGLDLPGDQSAQSLYNELVKNPKWKSQLGEDSILFFGSSKFLITHVAIAIDGHFMLEAGGGNSTTINPTEAAKKGAMVRVRPLRKDLVAVLKFI